MVRYIQMVACGQCLIYYLQRIPYLIYSGQKQDGIYAYFRGEDPVHGTIIKPTGKRDEQLYLNGKYRIAWEKCGEMKFYFIRL